MIFWKNCEFFFKVLHINLADLCNHSYLSSKKMLSNGPPLARVKSFDLTDERELDKLEYTKFEVRRQ